MVWKIIWYLKILKIPVNKTGGKIFKNLKDLRVRDVLKFVVGSEEDLEAAKYIINTYHPRSRIYLSPVFGEIEAKDIVKFVLDNNLSSVYTQVQLHKIIWDPDMKGV